MPSFLDFLLFSSLYKYAKDKRENYYAYCEEENEDNDDYDEYKEDWEDDEDEYE